MVKYIFIVFSIVTLTDCNNYKKKSSLITKTNNSTNLPDSTTDDSINELIDKIKLGNCVYDKYIGISGEKSKEYSCFEKLKTLSTDSFLLSMTHDSSTILKIYAYNALIDRNSNLAKSAQEYLRSDSSVFCYQTNDVILNFSVADYVIKFKPPK